MQAIQVATGATPTLLAAAGPRKFLHVFNNSDVTIYIGYDGDTANPLTTLNGYPLLPTGTLVLDNVGPVKIYDAKVEAVHDAAGNKEVRIVGA